MTRLQFPDFAIASLMENNENDFLMLSGLTHFAFCRRRWALVHIEQLWKENVFTLDGHYMHERVHDAGFTESRGSVLLSRAMPVRSQKLRINGECDMVELHRDSAGVPIQGRDGLWRLYPVEYKRGKPDGRNAAELQLCAQAMCLEEMFVTEIPEGAIYYGETRRRLKVALTEELRRQVCGLLDEMHALFDRGYTPKVKPTPACKSCSMAEICLPLLNKRPSAAEYVRRKLLEEDSE